MPAGLLPVPGACGKSLCPLPRPAPRDHTHAALLDLFREIVLVAWREQLDADRTARSGGDAERRKLEEEKRAVLALMKTNWDNESLLAELRRDFERIEGEISLLDAGGSEVSVLEKYDPEEVIRSCCHFLENVGELWEKWPVEGKSMIQRLVLPAGLPNDVLEGRRTPTLSLVYALIPNPHAPVSEMAGPTARVTNSDHVQELIRWFVLLPQAGQSGNSW